MASSMFHHGKLKILIIAAIALSVAAEDGDCSKLKSVKDTCKATLYPDLCYNTLFLLIGSNADPQVIFKQSAEVAKDEVSKASVYFAAKGELEQILIKRMPDNKLAFSALKDCRFLCSLALFNIDNSLLSDLKSKEAYDDIRTWLGSVDADMESCWDEFHDISSDVRNLVVEKLKKSNEYALISLEIICNIGRCAGLSAIEANKNG